MIGGHTGRNSALLLAGAVVAAAWLGWGTGWLHPGKKAQEAAEKAPVASVAAPEAAPVAESAAAAEPSDKAAGKRAKGGAAKKSAKAETPAPSATEAERELFRLQQENVRLRARLDDMLNWILDNVRGNYLLPEEQMENLRIRPLAEDGGVSGDLETVLRLDEREVQRLESAFDESRGVLLELESEGITVSSPADYQTVLNIPPYADAGGEVVREELYRQLQQTLGKARFDRFLQIAGEGLDEQFGHFGGEDRTLAFEAFEDEESGEEQLYVRDERAVPDAEEIGRVNVTSIERIVSRLPEEYYGYRDWLPDYVTRFAGEAFP